MLGDVEHGPWLGGCMRKLLMILKSEALAVDADDDRVVEDPIEHRHGQHGVRLRGTNDAGDRKRLLGLTLLPAGRG